MLRNLLGPLVIPTLLLLNVSTTQAQTIRKIVNDYARVSNIAGTTLTLTGSYSTASFSVGKRVVIIQMKGASIQTNSASASFGSIDAINNAGNYEFATIASVNTTDNNVKLSQGLTATYSTSGIVQLVSAPQYTNVTVDSTLTASPWNPFTGTGGVLVLEVGNTLTLQADIDVSGLGFKGGSANVTPDGNNNISTVYAASDASGFAGKGEGIASIATSQQNARGPLASGGGGGSMHNAGGGGGSNYTTGGLGGHGYVGKGIDYGPGLGGKSLGSYYATAKLFLGGGGGGGQQNNGNASAGANGGGIAIIRAGKITTSGAQSILSNGSKALSSNNDGAGGGGAGGTIVLDINNYLLSATNTLAAHANGGHGGNVANQEMHGSGGGGGTGIILYSRPTLPANATFSSIPGNPGNDCIACPSSGSAGDGATNCTSGCSVPNYTLPGDLPLPIVLVRFNGYYANGKVVLDWQTASETHNQFFTMERSKDAASFTSILQVASKNGNTREVQSYTAIDSAPAKGVNYYQLRQTDIDGKTTVSKMIAVYSSPGKGVIKLYPNPTFGNLTYLIVDEADEEAVLYIRITNAQGKEIYRNTIQRKTAQLQLSGCSIPGLYIVQIADGQHLYTEKLIVQ